MQLIKEREVLFFRDSNGVEPFLKWLNKLEKTTRVKIEQRILRVSLGNFGDYKVLQQGVKELRFKFGSGYRVYFGEDGDKVVILLSGGDKSSQNKDIKKAIRYWMEYKDG